MKKRKLLIVVLVIVFLFSALLYGIYYLSNLFGKRELEAALGDLQNKFPSAFSKLDEKFGNDLEIVDVQRWDIHITCKYNAEFEKKYNASNKPTEEFLQDVADEWFECFHNEIIDELESNGTDFKFPVSISFKFEKGSEYELLTFSYEDFDKCNVIRHEKW